MNPAVPGKRHIHVAGDLRHMHAWIPNRPDHRDMHYAFSPLDAIEAARLPRASHKFVKDYDKEVGIYDQGSSGSCTAHGGVVQPFRFLYWKAKLPKAAEFSPMATYAWTRKKVEGTPLTEDSGCQVRDAVECGRQLGLCPTDIWTCDPGRYDLEPPTAAETAALDHQIISYHRIPNLAGIKSQIDNFYPVTGGFTCFESLEDPNVATTGIIPVPGRSEQVIGGHCVLFCAYDDDFPTGGGRAGAVFFPNSWGRSWGNRLGIAGWGALPYWYFEQHQATDFQVIHVGEIVK